jgi:hypothetical protein
MLFRLIDRCFTGFNGSLDGGDAGEAVADLDIEGVEDAVLGQFVVEVPFLTRVSREPHYRERPLNDSVGLETCR